MSRPKEYKRILIIKMSSLGDVLHAMPTLAAAREAWPDAHITWAVHKEFSALLPGKPYIDEVVYIDRKKLKNIPYLWDLRKILHAHQFDLCIDLQCLAKSALVALLSGAKEKYGYWETREGSGLIVKPLVGPHKYGHVVERYLDTVRVLSGLNFDHNDIIFPLVDTSKEERVVTERLHEEHIAKPYVVLAPASRWPTKEWPLPYFATVAKQMSEDGYSVLLIGTKEEANKCQQLLTLTEKISNKSRVVNMAGKTTLTELLAIIKGANLFIGIDSGPLHMANALQVPIISLFGPTSPDRTGPYGNNASIRNITSPLTKATSDIPAIDDPECMKALLPEMVLSVYEEWKEKGVIHVPTQW